MIEELGFWGCIVAVAVWSTALGLLIGGWWDMRAERRRLEVRTREAEGFMAEGRADMARLRSLTAEGRRNAAEPSSRAHWGGETADGLPRGLDERSVMTGVSYGPPDSWDKDGWSTGGDAGNILGVFKLSQGWAARCIGMIPLTFEFRKVPPKYTREDYRRAGVPMNDY